MSMNFQVLIIQNFLPNLARSYKRSRILFEIQIDLEILVSVDFATLTLPTFFLFPKWIALSLVFLCPVTIPRRLIVASPRKSSEFPFYKIAQVFVQLNKESWQVFRNFISSLTSNFRLFLHWHKGFLFILYTMDNEYKILQRVQVRIPSIHKLYVMIRNDRYQVVGKNEQI